MTASENPQAPLQLLQNAEQRRDISPDISNDAFAAHISGWAAAELHRDLVETNPNLMKKLHPVPSSDSQSLISNP